MPQGISVPLAFFTTTVAGSTVYDAFDVDRLITPAPLSVISVTITSDAPGEIPSMIEVITPLALLRLEICAWPELINWTNFGHDMRLLAESNIGVISDIWFSVVPLILREYAPLPRLLMPSTVVLVIFIAASRSLTVAF